MKYIDADKLRADIKRRITDNTFGAKLELMDILSFLDTLEEPVMDDLEEAAIDFADYARKQPKDYAISSIADYDHGCIDGFKAGAEWQKKQIPMPEDTVIFQKGVAEGRRLEREDALTIADIEKLHTFLYAVKNNKQGAFTFTRLSDEQYGEVLRRFNKTKEQRPSKSFACGSL